MIPSTPSPDGPDRAALTPDGSTFEILGYSYGDGVFTGHFRGLVNGEETDFAERIDFRTLGSPHEPRPALLRLLTLAVSLSYYKATRAEHIRIDLPTSAAELAFTRALIENGLGEYAYVNDAEWKLTPRIEATPAPEAAFAEPDPTAGSRPLVAVGGGKDSIVTIEALKAAGHDPLLFSVGDRGAIRQSVAVSGCEYVAIVRTIDPALLRANAAGAPNGHVPVTAMNSLIGLIAAELAGSGPVIFSNEQSADYGNLSWHGREINHQWSKSLAYEDLLRGTLTSDGLDPDRFFSLLRGYRGIEITRDFARYPQYFDAFVSCNRAYTLDPHTRASAWCGQCPKCAFVFLLLAPYIPRERLVAIFARDMLAEPDQAERFREILGHGEHKPFECVGEPVEAVEALRLVDAGGRWDDSALVQSLVGTLTPDERELPLPTSAAVPRVDRVPAGYRSARDLIGRA